MFHRLPPVAALVTLCLLLAACHSAPPVMHATGRGAAVHARGAIACVHPLAARAALDAFDRGGNAVDAAVAAALTLGVVDSHNSGIGGGCFVLIRRADGELLAIDGRETAPAAATADMFIRGGKADTALSQTGALAIGIPGSVAAYDHVLRQCGRLSLADLLRPAADLAERGYVLDAGQARRLASNAALLARFEGSRAVLLDAAGKPWLKGHVLKQPDLARTYRSIADEGIDHFYGGAFAHSVERWMKQHGGIATAQDFANYRIKVREPITGTYRGHTVVSFPPPSSGGVHLIQMLNMLEQEDLSAMERRDPAARLHVAAEAMKLAFADRAYWLGDPDHARVPRGLLDKDYARSLWKNVDLARAAELPGHGDPPDADRDFFGKHTTHIAAADVDGNWVAITGTVNTSFGSKVIIPGTGVVMNNQMDDFAVQPGVPNAFGLIGAEANAVAPGKRPLSSMTPTIVLRDGKPVLTLGAAGGPTIITAVLTTVINTIDLGMPPAAAVAAPRLHHQWRPNELRVEQAVPAAVAERLRTRGHTLREVNQLAVLQAIGIDADDAWHAVTDPRVAGD